MDDLLRDKKFEVLIQSRPESTEDWNNSVSSFTQGTFFQTTYWGDYLFRYKNCEPYYISCKKDNLPIGQCLMWKEWVKISGLRCFPRLFCSYGPLLIEYNKENIDKFLEVIDNICDRDKIISLEKLTVTLHTGSFALNENINNHLLISKNHSYYKWATILLDLSKKDDELWEGISYSAKKCLKRNEKEKIEVVIAHTNDDFDEYYKLLSSFMEKNRNKMPYFTPAIWRFFQKDNKCMQIFLAKHNGIVHGGLSILYFNGIIFEIGACRSEYAIKHNLFVGDAIKWEVIRWANKQGFRLYDLSGVSPVISSEKERGIRKFKEKWGGEPIDYYIYSKIYRRNAYFLYNIIKKIYKLKSKLKI